MLAWGSQHDARLTASKKTGRNEIIYQIRRRKNDLWRVFNAADFDISGQSPEWRVTHQPSQLVFFVGIDGDGKSWDLFAMLGTSREREDRFSTREINELGRLSINAVIAFECLAYHRAASVTEILFRDIDRTAHHGEQR